MQFPIGGQYGVMAKDDVRSRSRLVVNYECKQSRDLPIVITIFVAITTSLYTPTPDIIFCQCCIDPLYGSCTLLLWARSSEPICTSRDGPISKWWL